MLAGHGVDVADSRVVESVQRGHLISARFDRTGARGRRHVVPVGAVHQAFVPDACLHWAAVGGAADHSPFEPDARSLASAAAGPASVFWQR